MQPSKPVFKFRIEQVRPERINGFTLFEILLVIFIVGLTASIVIPSFNIVSRDNTPGQLHHVFNQASIMALEKEKGLDIEFTKTNIRIDEQVWEYPESIKPDSEINQMVRVDENGFFYPQKIILTNKNHDVICQFNWTDVQISETKEN